MIYLTNRDGGKTDEAGHYQFLASGFNGNVLNGLTLVQTSPLGMKLNLTAGNARIPYGGYAYSAFVQEGETHEVQIGTANPSNPRIDRVVMYIDRAMARQTVDPNNPGIAKIAVVAGTPAGTPVRPSDVSVNSAVDNNPWIDLADVRVNTGVTQITTANVTDKRVMASAVIGPKAVTLPKLNGGSTGGALLTDASGNVTGGKVTADKIDLTTLGPVGTIQQYFGNKQTFDADNSHYGWLFMEKGTTYSKATYQRLYNHLKAVDVGSVVEDGGATFKFANKFFGTVAVGLDGGQTEFNTLGKSVGAKTHTLTIEEMPSHSHPLHTASTAGNVGGTLVRGNTYLSDDTTWGSGGSQPHNNLQPYITCYMWRRTA